jgi:hypothetical protein
MLGKELLGKSQKLTPVEAFGKQLYVKRMTGLQREFIEREGGKPVPVHSRRAMTVCYCLCDQDGTRLFEDKDLADLDNEPYHELDKVAEVAYVFNEMDRAALERLKKTLETILSENSVSDSPSTSDAPSTNSSTESTPQS